MERQGAGAGTQAANANLLLNKSGTNTGGEQIEYGGTEFGLQQQAA